MQRCDVTGAETVVLCALLAIGLVSFCLATGLLTLRWMAKRTDAIECVRIVRHVNQQCQNDAMDRARSL